MIISREIAVTGLRNLAYSRGLTMPASGLGKLKMASQVTAILLLILGWERVPLLVVLGQAAMWVVLVTALVSAVDYYQGFQRAMISREREGRRLRGGEVGEREEDLVSCDLVIVILLDAGGAARRRRRARSRRRAAVTTTFDVCSLDGHHHRLAHVDQRQAVVEVAIDRIAVAGDDAVHRAAIDRQHIAVAEHRRDCRCRTGCWRDRRSPA